MSSTTIIIIIVEPMISDWLLIRTYLKALNMAVAKKGLKWTISRLLLTKRLEFETSWK